MENIIMVKSSGDDKRQVNSKLTYEEVLNELVALRSKVEDRTEKLSVQEQAAEQKEINNLFEQAKNKVNNDNVNKQDKGYRLLELAAKLGKDEIIQHLLTNHLESLKEEPEQLDWAIYWAADNGHHQALKLLVTKDILEQLRYNSKESKEVFGTIKNGLTDFKNDEDAGVSQEVKGIITQALATIEEINRYPEVLEDLEALSNQEQLDQGEINKKFAEAINLANKNNVNYQQDNYTLLELAAKLGNIDTVNYLLEKHLETLKEEPDQLGSSIYEAADNGHDKTLKLLVTKDILKQLQKQSPKTLQEFEESLNDLKKHEDITPAVQKVVSEGLKNINELRNRKTVKTALVAGGVVAGGAAAVVGATFVSALLAKKGLNLVKDTRLVTNHLLPAFNKVNDQLMRISSKLDLNKLAKAFTDPKIAALMVGMSAILGVISSIVAGVGAHKKQGGTILGR
jgi:ankyrin repeat protein